MNKEERKKNYDHRMRVLSRLRILIVLLAIVGCVMVSPSLKSLVTGFLPSASAPEKPANLLLVNLSHPLPEGYHPKELVCLYEMRHSFRMASSDIYMEKEVYEAMQEMFAAAEEQDMNGFIITSGFRTAEKQQQIYTEQGSELAAPPGCSEHETGLSFDVTTRYDSGTFSDTAQYRWLIANCARYGFILRYPEGKQQVTGFAPESWHYRYVGTKAAQEIMSSGITLEEYLQKGGNL